jgi:hypothetical protein
MSKSPKGDNPGDRPQDGGKRESWENIDYGWEHLEAPPPEGAPTLQQKLPGGLVPELTPPEPAPTPDLDSAAPLNLDLTPPPPSGPQARGLRTLQMDRPARGLRTLVDESAPQEQDLAPLAPLSIDEEVEAEELPTPNPVEERAAVGPRMDDTLPLREEESPADSGDWESRALPVAPPGHRRVARTIVGLGAPDLQALMRAEKIVRSAAAGSLRTDEMPIFVAQSAVEEASTLKARRPAPPVATNETARRLSALDDAETSVEARASEPAPTPRGPSVQRLVVPEPGSAVFDDDVIEYAKTPPSEESTITHQRSSEKAPREAAPREAAPTPREAAPEPAPAPPAPAPPSVRRRDEAAPPALSPAAPVEPPVVMPPSLLKPSLVQAPAQGPSNLTLAILWIVAVASVGLAIFLYATRG